MDNCENNLENIIKENDNTITLSALTKYIQGSYVLELLSFSHYETIPDYLRIIEKHNVEHEINNILELIREYQRRDISFFENKIIIELFQQTINKRLYLECKFDKIDLIILQNRIYELNEKLITLNSNCININHDFNYQA